MDDKGLLEAVQTAIEAERAAREFYLAAAEKTASPQGKALLLQLADFEAYHAQKLLDLVGSLGAGRYIAYEGKAFARPRPEGGRTSEQETNLREVVDVLTLAMDAEQKAQARYQRLAESTTDLLGKAMFERLAEEEATHYRILSDEFYTLSNKGLWVWAE
ncbi:MAG: ferritin family protein [Anaerolineae bacterium]|jgi:rubrerythrin|nr:ferritin family protein [Anaerolineae bacterium]